MPVSAASRLGIGDLLDEVVKYFDCAKLEEEEDERPRIAVVGNSTEPCWPCGACRQMLYEFAPGLTVLVAQRDHSFVKLPLSELLTHGFGPKSLG